jgi:hypothetical protein
MTSTLIKGIDSKTINTYFKTRQYEAMYWASFFPVKNVLSLDYTTLIGEQSGRVAADVIAYDSSAPLKTRQVVSKLTGAIPKIAVKRKMSESDLNDYFMLSRMADTEQKQLLNMIWNDVDFVVDGVNARMEWMALQAVSKTVITLDTNNNNGIVTASNIDFQMPTANKKAASVVWSASASTTKPITDIKAVVKAGRDLGIKFQAILIHPDMYDYFVLSTETQTFLKSYFNLSAESVNILESVEAVNRVMTANSLPYFVKMEQSVGIESKAGVITYVNPFDSNYITFIPEMKLGDMLNGPIAEEIAPPKQVIQSKFGNILVSKYSEADPFAEFTKGETNAFPSWKNVNTCMSMKTTATSWS